MQVTVKTDNDSLLQMFAVEPKRDCPHIIEQYITLSDETLQNYKQKIFELPCKQCDDKKENWICLVCNEIHCSRYVNAHMVEHCTKEKHGIALSLIDLSFWCYDCNSYITNFELDKLRLKFSNIKFPSINDVENLADQLSLLELGNQDKAQEVLDKIKNEESKKEKNLQDQQQKEKEQKQKEGQQKQQEKEEVKQEIIEQPKEKEQFQYEELINGIKNKEYVKIVFLTGAGISVAAGIPDFRSPGSGLYSKLGKYNLEYPEQIFEIPFFKENPEPFYQVASEFLMMNANPVNAHYFQTLLQNRQQLLLSLTQNIDGLELLADLDEKFLVQAHGHLRSAHCIECFKEIDINILTKHIKEKDIMKCECGGLCKPDIVFFGEPLPKEFFSKISQLKQADLAIIMGTSLAVAPFNYYVETFLKGTPIVCINKTKPQSINYFKKCLYLNGDIEEQLQRIIKDCEFEEEFQKLKEKK